LSKKKKQEDLPVKDAKL